MQASDLYGQTLVINTSHTYPRSTPDGLGFQDLIIKEAFRRVGIPITIVHLPSERALRTVNAGIDDGNYARVAGMEKKFPNLIMVPERISEFYFSAFTTNPSIIVTDWDSLRPYNVAIITGWKILEEKITNTHSLTKVKDETSLFHLLTLNRADIVVFDLLQGKGFIKKNNLNGIVALSPPLAQRDMYLYMNKRHAALVPQISSSLKSMKEDGTYKKIVDSVCAE